MLPQLIAKLPERFHWTLHNVVGHPLSELLFQAANLLPQNNLRKTLRKLSDTVHDETVPDGYED